MFFVIESHSTSFILRFAIIVLFIRCSLFFVKKNKYDFFCV